MAIKPLDIRRKEFKNSLRGYEQNGVDDFLDTVADEFEKIYSENQRMKDQVSSLRERLEQFDDLEGSIRAALVHAEQAASDLRASAARDAEDTRHTAQREADLTIRDAKAQAHQMLAESSGRVERVRESYEALQEARGTFAADFRHLLQTYMSVMDNMDVATAKQIEATLRERLDPESIAVARETAANENAAQRSASTQDTLIQAPDDTSDEDPTDAGASEDTASDNEADEAPAFESSQGQESWSEDEDREQDPNTTQRIVPGTVDYSDGGSEPEVEEPEVEPSSSALEDTTGQTGPLSEADQPEHEESAAVESSEEASQDTSDEDQTAEDDTQERTLASDPSSEGFFEEPQQSDGRISRAGRFLRRRG